MSSSLQSQHIYHFEGDGSNASQAHENTVFPIDEATAMAMNLDRTNETKAVFLKSAVMARPWVFIGMFSPKCERDSYQDIIYGL